MKNEARDPRRLVRRETKRVGALAGVILAVVALSGLRSVAGEPSLPRPGAVTVAEVVGDVIADAGDQKKTLQAEDRLRVGSIVTTGRLAYVTLTLSNGTTLRIGPEAELEIEEFGQAPFSGSAKVAEMKAEPSVSRTRLKLVRGDVELDVKPLNVARGSSLLLATAAGTARVHDGALHARVRMSDVGLGVCTLLVKRGAAEFELPGASFVALPVGRKVAYALEVDRVTQQMKVSEILEAAKSYKR